MTRNHWLHLTATLFLTLFAQGAFAAMTCDDLLRISDCHNRYDLDPTLVKKCILRGYDAPVSCRKDEGKSAGVKVSGANGFSYGTVQAPSTPPGVMTSVPSVSVAVIRRTQDPSMKKSTCDLPGFFKLDICKCVKNIKNALKCAESVGDWDPTKPLPADYDVSCPIKSESTGMYGQKYPSASGSLKTGTYGMSCGGAVPLSTYELTLNANADRFAVTEYGAFWIRLYRKQGTRFTGINGNPIKLPSILCKPHLDSNGKPVYDKPTGKQVMEKTVDLTAPIAQMITYNAASKSITLRLQPRENIDTSANPPMIPQYNPKEPEKFLIFPLRPDNSGELIMPNTTPVAYPSYKDSNDPMKDPYYLDCPLESDYYKSENDSVADIVIQSAIVDASGANLERCNQLSGSNKTNCLNQVTVPTTPQNCQIVTTSPKGTVNTTAGPVVCDSKTQYMVLDRPNLIFPPNTNATALSVADYTSVLVESVTGSYLQMQSTTNIRIGKTASSLVFATGGSIKVPYPSPNTNNQYYTLTMSNDAVVSMQNGEVTLTNGGHLVNADGSMNAQYSPGQKINVNTIAAATQNTLTVNPLGKMLLPEGYLVPTQPKPYIQYPVD